MVFGASLDCKCCRNWLWHCQKCWTLHHNGLKDQDYIPPKYYGQPMKEFTNEQIKEALQLGIDLEHEDLTIRPMKNKLYEEGMYH